jgi:chaperonin cofactor prefoldin
MFVQNLKERKFMPNPTVAELQKELDDLKIRVNNLEKRMAALKQKPPAQRQKFI